jgi:regulatory protein
MNSENQQKCLKYFLNLLGKRDYSCYQLNKKGNLKKFEQTDIDYAINWLIEYNYVNDERLAINLIEFYNGQKGEQWFKMKLSQKGIDQEIIKKLLSELKIEPNAEIKDRLAQKLKIDSWQNLDIKQKNKIIYFLSSRGFSNPFGILNSWQTKN